MWDATIKRDDFVKAIKDQGGIDVSAGNLAGAALTDKQREVLGKLGGLDNFIKPDQAQKVWELVVDIFDGNPGDGQAIPNKDLPIPPPPPELTKHILTNMMAPKKSSGVNTSKPSVPSTRTPSTRSTRTL